MRPAPRYPVDRYLVESSKKFEIVNIIDDEIWHQEPALRPEDEIILRKLHDMLQSTADDLKMLSGELSKFHQPGVQVKTQPTPLDEEFNEKVHIEEIVNAKFHGHKFIDKPTQLPITKDVKVIKPVVNSDSVQKLKVSTGTQISSVPVKKRTVFGKNLVVTRPKVIEVGEGKDGTNNKLNNGQVIKNMPAVAYNEFSFKYVEPKNKFMPVKVLQVQHMPKINIRSELKEQKVLHLDIIPDSQDNAVNTISKTNVAVISVDHDVEVNSMLVQKTECVPKVNYQRPTSVIRQTSRKVSKMSTYESSASTNNSDTQHNYKKQKLLKNVIRSSPKNSARLIKSKKVVSKKEPEKRPHLNLDEWTKKLDRVYGQPSTSRYKSNLKPLKKSLPKKANEVSSGVSKPPSKILNNAEYIPYSHLTLGGARVSDIERELSEIPNKNNVPLSPILDKILSSKETSPRKIKKKKIRSQNIFTTSDENLLQEVIEIEKTVNETISKNFVQNSKDKTQILQKVSNKSSEDNEEDSYADDFEDEKSNDSQDSDKKPKSSGSPSKKGFSDHSDVNSSSETDDDDNDSDQNKGQNIQNSTFTKATSLSFKESVDVFEFVHAVDTQETATQSNTTNKLSLKETQTSPRNDRPNIRPIHNDLWPTIDPNGEVVKMFKLEKDFIKKLILEEYGDLLEKNITKPSTSQDSRDQENRDKNVATYQKNTQTSPAHVKSVMTSPTRTKTRMTSPFLSVTVDHHTSPVIIVSNEEKVKLEIDDDEDGISINLSSPRFSLRLPQTSREVLSNLEMSNASIQIENANKEQNVNNHLPSKANKFTNKTYRKTSISSSSIDDDISSSEISSLGEIKLKLKKRLKKRAPAISQSDSSSTVSKSSLEVPSGGILPLKSEGELSSSQGRRKFSKSDGEGSFGQTK